ncbi:MAG TPA: hypothetical protein VFK12_09390 [Gammaproteobacteria bacterium]|nr:hypothetical protein [Gammaproteobacteria bacterium]
MSQVIAVIAAIVSAAFAGLGLLAANKSAAAAEQSAQQAQKTESHILVLELVLSAEKGLAELGRVESLVMILQRDYNSLYALSGRDVSAAQPKIDEIKKKAQELLLESEYSKEMIHGASRLAIASPEDLNKALVKCAAFGARASITREHFEHQLSDLSAQIQPLRERALKN